MIKSLLSERKVGSLEMILDIIHKSGINLNSMIDGGAGWGDTAIKMLSYGSSKTKIHAFEPFVGNHKFFNDLDERIVLHKSALGSENTTSKFYVSSIVDPNSTWGKKGFSGYSSVGFIQPQTIKRKIKQMLGITKGHVHEVSVVKADTIIPADEKIDFIKLDLQGGELDALEGMTKILKSVKYMWIEYSGQPNLVDFLLENNFVLYDTEYLFQGEVPINNNSFLVSESKIPLSNGLNAWKGFRNFKWQSFEKELLNYKSKLNLIQTDLFCIHIDFNDYFEEKINQF